MRHVAIDAIAGDLKAEFFEFSALFFFVAGEATRRKFRKIALRAVDVMAS